MKREGIRQKIKYMAGYMHCKAGHVSIGKRSRVYIGKGVKIVGGANISLGPCVSIRPYVQLWCGSGSIQIGSGTELGERSRISIINSLVVGEKVLFSPNVYLTDCDHAYEEVGIPVMEQGTVKRDYGVVIKDHAFVGINTVIIGNVTVGQGSVVGANSVVTKDIPDYCVAVGAPAKVVKRYNFETGKWEKV